MVATVSPSPTARLPQLAKYEVVEEIGHGGMATVYRAKDPRLGRDVAIKLIHRHLRDSTEIAARFTTEAQAVAKLRHPNIVEVFDVSGDDDDERYLVVELIRGRTLRALLKEQGALPPEVAACLAVELLSALAHAHEEGIVHRDVKPENVLIEMGHKGDAVKVKLTDFGIAKLLDEKGVTSTGQVLGSPAHMAPEQIEGGAVDARSDVFGMGVLLYECMVGHLPFEGNNPAQVLRRVLDGQYPQAELELPVVGKKFSLILDQALAHQQDERYATAEAMRDALLGELKRLGVTDPKAELRAYLEAPAEYVTEHAKRMVQSLVALGATARKEQRVLDAAADYNRALAYAPNDPSLLKIVSGMHRAEARARTIKRVTPLVAGAVLACLLAFGLAKLLQKPAQLVDPTLVTSASGGASGAPTASAPPSSSAVTTASVPSSTGAPTASIPTAATAVRTVLVPLPTLEAGASAPADISRSVTFASIRPENGVLLVVDDGAPQDVTSGTAIKLDGAAHTLHFRCKESACDEDVHAIAAGRADETIPLVKLAFKPATLIVIGTAAAYTITEFPKLSVSPGTPTTIPMTEFRVTTEIYESSSPTKKKSVTLVAGAQANVTL
jgi:serine/threonine-protein kinase